MSRVLSAVLTASKNLLASPESAPISRGAAGPLAAALLQTLALLEPELEGAAAGATNTAHKAEKKVSHLWWEFQEACFGCGTVGVPTGGGPDGGGSVLGDDVGGGNSRGGRGFAEREEELRVAVAHRASGGSGGAGGGGGDRRRRRVGGGLVAKGSASAAVTSEGEKTGELQSGGDGDAAVGSVERGRVPWVD
ncbi:unnamed protein product [Ectocarpus fasciculatus]